MIRTNPRRAIQELSRGSARMFKAYLAEGYDGIGQYVKIALTKGGVTNALQGRIAAGDFGGGRTFPEGTPVVVAVQHGHMEVFLGNIPSGACDLLNRDSPEPNGGWGTGPYGPWLTTVEMTEISTLSHAENGWSEGGAGIFQYTHSPANDPAMGLKFTDGLEYPIEVTIEYYVSGAVREVDLNNWVIYFGPQYYQDINTWVVLLSFRDDFSHTGIYGFDHRDWPPDFVWPLPAFGASYEDAPESIAEAEEPHRVKIRIDEDGVNAKVWRPSVAGEPTDWQMHDSWTDTPPPASYFRFIYMETQGFNNPIGSAVQPKFHINTFCLNEDPK